MDQLRINRLKQTNNLKKGFKQPEEQKEGGEPTGVEESNYDVPNDDDHLAMQPGGEEESQQDGIDINDDDISE